MSAERIESADVIVWGEGSRFAQQIAVGPHRLNGDEPERVGGTGTGPSPYDFLLAALGSCTSMTVGMYARHKNWPLERVTVWLRHSKIYAADCSECETKEGMLDRIERDVRFDGPLTLEQRSRLLEIANKCPVHRTLTSEINIRTRALIDRALLQIRVLHNKTLRIPRHAIVAPENLEMSERMWLILPS